MKTRINISISETALAWLKNKAKERDTSVSRVIAELIINECGRESFDAAAVWKAAKRRQK